MCLAPPTQSFGGTCPRTRPRRRHRHQRRNPVRRSPLSRPRRQTARCWQGSGRWPSPSSPTRRRPSNQLRALSNRHHRVFVLLTVLAAVVPGRFMCDHRHRLIACVDVHERPALPQPSVPDSGGLVGRSTIDYSIGTTAHQQLIYQRTVRARPHCTCGMPALAPRMPC